MSTRRASTTTWIRLVLAATMAVALGLVVTPSGDTPVAEAANVAPETSFQIDGDRLGPNDFAAPYGPGLTPGGFPTTGLYYNNRTFDQNLASGCDINNDPSTAKGGVKVEDGPIWLSPGTDPNGKTDLDFIDIAAEKVNKSGDIFDIIYVGYRKCGGEGTWQTSLYLDDGDGVLPSQGDANGDYLFLFEFQPSSGNVDFREYRREAGAWAVQASTGTFIDGSAVGDYGEVALNLTELIFTDDQGILTCNSFVLSGPAASLTGGSFGLTSQPKDLLGFAPLRIDNCGGLDVDKQANPDVASDVTFGYAVAQADADGSQSGTGTVHDGSLQVTGVVAPASTGEPDGDNEEIDATIVIGQTHEWRKVVAAPDYSIVEQVPLPAGWAIDSIVCSGVDIFTAGRPIVEVVVYENGAYTSNRFPIAPDTLAGVDLADSTCTITNATSGIVIAKTGSGAATTFDFTVNGAPVSVDLGASSDVIPFAPGTAVTIVELDEQAELAWEFQGVQCDDPGPTSSGTPSVGVTTIAGTVITCTFTNVQDAKLFVQKLGAPDDGTSFDFDTDANDGDLDGTDDLAAIINGAAVEVAGADAGDTIKIDELTPAGWILNSVGCATTSGGNSVQGSTFDVSGTASDAVVDLAAGEVVHCTFTNTENGSIVVEKTTVDGDDTFSFTGPGALAGSITTVNGSGTTTLSQDLTPGAYSVDEVVTPGYALTNITCVDPSGGTTTDASGADVALAAGETVTCTFTNTRNSANFTLVKNWVDAIAGDTVTLAADGSDTNAEQISGVTAEAPASNSDSMTVYSGETVDFSETFGPGVAANYITQLVCADASGTLVNNSGNFSGELEIADDPSDITCTFTNTRRSSSLLLQKEWINGNGGDTAGLTAGGATATSTASGLFGSEIDGTNQAVIATVLVGDTIDLAEVLSAEANYNTSLECVGGDLTYTSGALSGSVEVLTTDEDSQIVCTFTNTRKQANLVLTKSWDDPVANSAVSLAITGGDATPVAGANASDDTVAVDATSVVYAGETLGLGEAFTANLAQNFDTQLNCGAHAVSYIAGAHNGSIAIGAADAGGTITCTFTNVRKRNQLTLQKSWVNPFEGDIADLDLDATNDDGVTAIAPAASGTSADTAAVTAYAGETVSLSEALGAGNTGSYDVTSFSCNAGTPNPAWVAGAAVLTVTLVPADVAAPITCTVTNTRTSADFTVEKAWVDPVGDSALTLNATGSDPNLGGVIAEPSTSPAAAGDTMVVYSGETVDFDEAFGVAADQARFDTTLVCVDGSGELLNNTNRSDQLTIGADPSDITCTFTNTRRSTTLELHKSWVNSAADDTYGLSIDATNDAGPVAATAPGGTGDSTELASIVVYAGETATLSEVVGGGNVGSYDVTGLDCTAGDSDWTIGSLTGTISVDAADIATNPIECEFTNDRTSTMFTLRKVWDDPAGGATVALAADGSDPDVGQSIADESVSATFFSSTITVYSGETVTMSEAFTAGSAADYASSLLCNDADATSGQYGASLSISADPSPIICTFTNFRLRTELTLEKNWVGAVDDDEADLSIAATESEGPTTALAPAGDGTSTESASITVYAGETVTLSEAIDPNGTNVALYDATDFQCTAGSENPSWSSGDVSVTLDLDAADVASPISCSFTNTARRGTVVIVKAIAGVNDGTFDFAGDWSDDGVNTTPPGTNPAGFEITTDGLNGSVTFNDVLVPKDGGAYTVTETDPTPAFDGTEVVCDNAGPVGRNGDGDLVGSFVLTNGATSTCTFTNTERSTIVIIKDARPNAATDFAFTGGLGAFSLDDDANGVLSNTFTSDLLNAEAGSTYTVAESPAPGWTLDLAESTCSNGDAFAGSGVVIDPAPGTTVTCTFVNNANPAGLSATKAVSGQVGPWGPFEFTLTGGAFTGAASQAVTSVDPTADWTNLVEGQQYTLTEAAVPGYEPDAAFACSVILPGQDADTLGDADAGTAGFQFTAVAGAIYDCDITNVAIPGSVDVTKSVTGVAADYDWSFEFTIDPLPVSDPAQNASQDATGTGNTTSAAVTWTDLVPGATYTITETVPAGWTQGDIACTVTAADDSTSDLDVASFTIEPGDSVSCDFDNAANPSEVEITKTVAGGVAVDWSFDFSISPVPATETSPKTASGIGDGSDTVSWGDLVPGETYTIAELANTNSTAYVAGVLSCAGLDDLGDDDQSFTFVAPLGVDGVEINCTITNMAQSDVIYEKLVDTVTRDATTGAWTITYLINVANAADGGAGFYDLDDEFNFGGGVSIVADSASVVNTVPGTITTDATFNGVDDTVVVADQAIAAAATHTYQVSVDVTIAVGPGTDGDCVSEDGEGTGFLNTMTIAVDGGEPQTTEACAGFAQLTLVKVLDNGDGGNATLADFPLTAAGPANLSGVSGTAGVSSAVPAGEFALSEVELVEGYTNLGWACVGAETSTSASVTLVDGENATCTIVNDDEPVDLQLTKDDGGITAVAGGAPFDYTISVQNVGTRDVDAGEAVTVTDELPTGLSWVSFPANCSQAAQVLTCDVDGALLPAGGAAVVITASVKAEANAPSGTYVNKASVTTDDDPVCVGAGCTPPPCPATANNNVDCEETPVNRVGAVQIIKTDNVADGVSVQPGGTFTYNLVVTNTGVSTILPGTHVADDLPAQLEFVSAVGGAGWTCNNVDPVDCDYAPSLAPGASAPPITVTVKVAAGATGTNIQNVAVVLAAVDRDCPTATDRLIESFTPACNQVTDDDDENTPLVANADLAIVKTASVDLLGAGGSFNWTLNIENKGAGTAFNVVIGDLVPSSLTVTGVSSNEFSCAANGNDVKCTIVSLPVGGSGTVTITVQVPITAVGGIVTNVGNVGSDTPDPNLTNNSDDASVTIVAQAPPTTTLPPVILPPTGSDGVFEMTRMAALILLLGGAALVAARRRRETIAAD